MGLFSYDFYGGGHGDHPNAPRKKGLARLWEVLREDALHLMGAGFLAALSVIPYAIGLMISIDSHALFPMAITCPLGGMLAAPQLCGLSDTILRALRDDHSRWWDTYRRAWKQNAKGCLLPGALGGLLFGFQLLMFYQIDVAEVDLFLLASMLLGAALSTAIASWLLPQLALMNLPLHRALLNAVLLCGGHPLKTLGTTLLQLAYWGLIVLAFPDTLILFVLLNFWAATFIVTFVQYEPLDSTFKIEASVAELERRRQEHPDGA